MRDEKGEIISQRKREMTSVHQTGCQWRVRVSWKRLNRRSDEKAFILTVSSLNYAERPRPRRSPSPEASPLAADEVYDLPTSTAPPALGRSKRRRNHTARYHEAYA